MDEKSCTLFLCGDAMTGRGIDRIMAHPGNPALFEPLVHDAEIYVELAERESGAIPRGVDAGYIWGEAMAEIDRVRPDARIINLETAITASDDLWPDKVVNYRTHPANVDCLSAARIDACALANNHLLDWGYAGLHDTVAALDGSGIRHAGAGATEAEAAAPAIIEYATGRILLFSLAATSSGTPAAWAAGNRQAGVQLLPDLSAATAKRLGRLWREARRPGDLLVASIHWGGNWGYEVDEDSRRFARLLIDEAGADLVHGHSSHHPRPMEVYRGRLVLYGCGDLINDYEGIGHYEAYRGELSLLYFPTLAGDGQLLSLRMVPMRIRRFRLQRASREEADWLAATLDRECRPFGARIGREADLSLTLRWQP